MLTEAEKRGFALSTIAPMADETLPFLTQVVGVIDDRSGEHLGTGYFCTLAGQQAVVTAAHVLRQAAAAGRYRGLAFARGSGEPPAVVAGKIVYRDDYDLAVYLPSRDFPAGAQKVFLPEDRIERGSDAWARDYLFVQGFPRRFSRFTTLGGEALVSETLAYGAMMRYQEKDIPAEERAQFDRDLPGYEFLPGDLLQPHQFALHFAVEPASFLDPGGVGPERRVSIIDDWSEVFRSGDTLPGQKSRGAFGLSGSPVWRIGAAGRPIRDWTPRQSRLVGTVTHWNEDHRVLIATAASKLFDVVGED